MTPPRLSWLFVGLALLATACGGDSAPADAGRDGAPLDASRDAASPPDAGRDVGSPDAGRDAGAADAGEADGGLDAGMDGGLDGGTDAGADAGESDGGLDAGADGGVDGGTDAGDDPDGDGFPTSVEIACGTDPGDGGSLPSPSTLVGAGTPEDPYRLCLPEHLTLFAELPGVTASHARLAVDLDLTGRAAPPPIGEELDPYVGTFDGAGHALTGLTFGATTEPRVGLFSHIGEAGVVRDFSLVDVVAFGAAPVAFHNFGTVERVRVSGEVTVDNRSALLVSYNWGTGRIVDCWSEGTVTAARSHNGGIAGQNEGLVLRCGTSATVTGRNRTGGLVGSGTGEIRECFATGAVTGDGFWLGGLVGSVRDGAVVEDSYAVGAVSAVGAAGGLVGNLEGSGRVARVYAQNTVSAAPAFGILGEDSSGGAGTLLQCYFDASATAADAVCAGLSSAEMAMQASFLGFDFTSPVWVVDGAIRATPSLHWE